MFPLLWQSPTLAVHAYGVFIGLGIFIALRTVWRESGKKGLSRLAHVEAALFAVIAAVVGARLLYVLQHFYYFQHNPLEALMVWRGGLVFHGGLIAAALGGLFYAKMLRLSGWSTLDIFAPAIAGGHAIGRIGCFLAGCCFGKSCHLPWGVTFTDPRGLSELGYVLHPTQLYEVVLNAMLCAALLAWLRREQRLDGRIFAGYLVLYSLMRFTVEFYRGDPRYWVGMLSTAQVTSLVLFAAGLVIWWARFAGENIRSREMK